MSGREQFPHGYRFIPALIIGAGAVYVWHVTGPIFKGPAIMPFPALAAGVVLLSAGAALSDLLHLAITGIEWLKATMPLGLRGTSGWISSLRELGDDVKRKGWGPYWGFFGKDEVIAGYEAVSVSIGTTGSSKSSGVVIPMALSILDSKIILDFKNSLAPMLVRILRARGERVRILNFSNKYEDILGKTDGYNLVAAVIAACFKRPGGLLEVNEILDEMTFQLIPQAKSGSGSGDNSEYWASGSRSITHFAIITGVLMDGDHSTLGDANQLLLNREELLRYAQWATGQLEVVVEDDGAGDPQDGFDDADFEWDWDE